MTDIGAEKARAATKEAILEYHLDRRVILSTESEFTSLYRWSLKELDAEDKQNDRDQIPWAWSLYFTATELALQDEFEIRPDYDCDDTDKKAVRENRSITAKLSPGDSRDRRAFPETIFSMFGTNRIIDDFILSISPITDEEEQEECSVWGCVSYTTEIDFINETIPDTVQFYLHVRPATFARYAAMIAASEVDEAVFRVGHVEGFYSDWSPSISTGSIKVLTRGGEHEVEIPEDCEIVPPRLGAVGEANLYLRRFSKLKTPKEEMSDETDEWLEEEELPLEATDDVKSQALNRLISANARTIDLLSSLRIAAWIIAVLLIVILVK